MTQHINKENHIYSLAIIGGGAAGLYAGALKNAGKAGGILLERMPETGKKLMITGSGQCNLTHRGEIRDFPAHYHEAGRKIRSLLYAHSNEKVVRFFSDLGIPTIEREDGKIFPASLSAREVRDALLARCAANGYRVLCNMHCTGLISLAAADSHGESFGESFSGARWKILSGDRSFFAKNVLVTVGGSSVPLTGSDGSFLQILAGLGIPLRQPEPALTAVYVQDYPFPDLSGISFEEARVTVSDRDGRKKCDSAGPLLFTHSALSGPCILNGSRYVQTGDKIALSYLPDVSADRLTGCLSKKAADSGAKARSAAAEALGELGYQFPQRFLERQLERSGVSPQKNAAEIGKKSWLKLALLLAADTFSVSGKGGFADAMVTRGGVSLSAVDGKTMESLQYPGLYFAGEVLDVDADTGGYNLQFAFSSAARAAEEIFGKG